MGDNRRRLLVRAQRDLHGLHDRLEPEEGSHQEVESEEKRKWTEIKCQFHQEFLMAIVHKVGLFKNNKVLYGQKWVQRLPLFQHTLIVEIRTLFTGLKSTLLLKIECRDTHTYMKTKWDKALFGGGKGKDRVALIINLIYLRVKRGTWGACYKRAKESQTKIVSWSLKPQNSGRCWEIVVVQSSLLK